MVINVAKSTAYYFSIWAGVITITFILFHVANESPARTILGPGADQQQILQLEKKLGLDQPKLVQMVNYFGRVLHMDFGHSYVDQRQVSKEVMRCLKITSLLVIPALFIILGYLFFVIWIHLVSKSGSLTDWFEVSARSFPIFFTGVIMAMLCAHFYPVIHFSGNLNSINDWLFMLPPALVLSVYPAAVLSEVLKKELSKTTGSLYITAARGFGFPERSLLFKHALRNTVIPVLAALSNILPVLFTGAFIVEIIFSIPGIGSLLIRSIMARDFPMIECIVILNSFIFVITNLIFDTAYQFIDPRMGGKND